MSFDITFVGKDLEEVPLLRFDNTICVGRVKALQRALLLLMKDNQGDNERLGTEFSTLFLGVSTSNVDTVTNNLGLVQAQLAYSLQQAQLNETLDDDEIVEDVNLEYLGLDADTGEGIVELTVTTVAGDTASTRIPQTYRAS